MSDLWTTFLHSEISRTRRKQKLVDLFFAWGSEGGKLMNRTFHKKTKDNSNFIVNFDFASRDRTKLRKRYKSREKKKYSNITTIVLENSFTVDTNVKTNNNFCIFWTIKSTLGKTDKFRFLFSFTRNTLPTRSVTAEKTPLLRPKLHMCQIVVSIPFLETFALFEVLRFQLLEQNRRLSSQIAP